MGLKAKYEAKKEQLGLPAEVPTIERRITNPRAVELFALEDRMGLQRENARLLEELQAERKRQPLQRLDPARIRPSRYMNREEGAFRDAAFEELKESIRIAGGNAVPIEVRPLSGDPSADFEIVYGHRRHRACSELGIPVAAIVNEELDDRAVYAAMTRENSQRNDLTPWEWGVFYRTGLQEHFDTAEQLAAETGRSKGHVSQALALVDLPPGVLAAFPDRRKMQLKWGVALRQALARGEAFVLRKAQELAGSRQRLDEREVFRALIEAGRRGRPGAQGGRRKAGSSVEIVGAEHKAVIRRESRATVIRLGGKALSDAQLEELRGLLERFLSVR